MKSKTKISLFAVALLSLQAVLANATTYVSTTRVDGTISASPWTSERVVNEAMYGEFYVSGLSVFSALNGDYTLGGFYIMQQQNAGTVSYDSETHLLTVSNADVWFGYVCIGCAPTIAYRGTLNLAFYVLGENPSDIRSVDGANYITLNQTQLSSTYPTWGNLYSPSRIDLSFSGEVPLPATAWLLGSGLLGLAASSKRKFRADQA